LRRCWEDGSEPPVHRFPRPDTVQGLVLSRCLGQALGHDLLPFWHEHPDRRNEVLDGLFVPDSGHEAIKRSVAKLAACCRLAQGV